MKQDMIVILDLGSHENTVLARAIRALGVYSEIYPHDITKEELQALPNVKGVIINGGPNNIIDGVEIDVLPEIYEAGYPVIAAFADVFERLAAAGDSAVVITLAHQLSGTCQSARIAAEDYDNIFVVDSGSVTLGAGILAEYALRCVDEGMDAESIAAAVEAKKEDVCLIAMLDTLEYLKKGGRISATVAFAGGLLNLKPVVNIKDGVINMLGKARGSKQGNNLLVQEINKAGGIDFSMPILLGYTGLTDVLLKKYMTDSAALWENGVENLPYTSIGSVVGTHAGPGAIAAAFFRK